jgi:hypothetical protein
MPESSSRHRRPDADMKIVEEVPEKTMQSGTSTDSLRVEHARVDALVILEAKYTVD